MKIIAVNGSPRKDHNTAQMLQSVLDGAKSVCPDVETKTVQLYDHDYTGCRSCFVCKLKDERYNGVKCFVQDGITDILDEVSACDGLILGTPIYFGMISGQMHCFLERLLFPYSTYEPDYRTTAPKHMPTVMLYTLNWPKEIAQQQYAGRFDQITGIIGNVFSPPEILYAYNTYQFDDYSKYHAPKFNEPKKAKYHREQFPLDLRSAFDAGARMMRKSCPDRP